MGGEVFFVNFEGTRGDSVLDKLKRLCNHAGLNKIIEEGDLVAIKLHFGELGNTRMLRPQFLKIIIQLVKERGGHPFLTDCNTLFYRGRFNAVCHLETANFNGYDQAAMGAPLIIADGLKGLDYRLARAREGLSEVKVGSAIYEADKLVVVTHFKGHDDVGFGGIIKNLGMGAIARPGKQAIHSHMKPVVETSLCNGCGKCVEVCKVKAIAIEEGKAFIEQGNCNNCGDCLVICPRKAIPVNWARDDKDMQRKLVESCAAVLANKKGRAFFVSFLVDITAFCDCRSWSPLPIIHDIGILAGTDPLAIEQASYDLVDMHIKAVYPEKALHDFTGVNGLYMLEYAETIGLGSREYQLIKL
ncbi:hypothetical protein MGLY_29450 [Neomoorella glycerini]|uniref:Ferredoxin n=1 Tax=Neomoorella glycerini TaxID=55779 RepID=A0A6I5ZW26_9FIRM|nr:DUF362 domain-containing protein [Moorella glycerini]QGP93531.1 hypothetical protein MGLY_29450 [Moorella glycerini]